MGDNGNDETIAKAIGAGAVGFGVAGLLAPEMLAKVYGMPPTTPSLRYISRLWGTTLASVGALSLTATSSTERKRLLMVGVALNAVDSLVAFASSDLPGRTRVLAGATSAGFAAAGALALTSGD